jgi:hypothetical protein
MSAAGTAIFAHDIEMVDSALLRMGAGGDFIATSDGSNALLYANNGNFVIDSAGEIYLDADGADIIFQDAGAEFGRISKGGGSDLIISAGIADKDIFFSGIDGSTSITALTLDMSNAGAATFNAGVTATSVDVNGQLNVTNSNSNTISCPQVATQFDTSSFMRFHPSATTDSNGYTNIIFGTSTANNYGVAIGGLREGSDGTPTFTVRMLNDSISGTLALKLTNDGELTLPGQPAFLAEPASTQSNIATGSFVTVVLGTERFDVGSNFASNTFTAPVTGKYQLNANIRLNSTDSAASYYQMRIRTSNKDYYSIFDPDFGQDAVYWSFGSAVLADMDAGDTANLEIIQLGGTAQADIHGDTKFSGYLVA